MKRKSSRGSASAALPTSEIRLCRAPAERWQRGSEYEEIYTDADSPVRTQRVYDTVAALEREGRISGEHVRAARTWCRDYERSMRSSYSHPATAGCGTGSTNAGPEMRLLGGIESAKRLAAATRAVGMVGDLYLREIVGNGLSLRALAEKLGRSRATLADDVVATLQRLEECYADLAREADAKRRKDTIAFDRGRDRAAEMAA